MPAKLVEDRKAATALAEESGERKIDLSTKHGGKLLLPATFVDSRRIRASMGRMLGSSQNRRWPDCCSSPRRG